MRTPVGSFIVLFIMIVLDIYVFMVIRSVSHSTNPITRSLIYWVYWLVSVITIIGVLIFMAKGIEYLPKKIRTYLFASILAFVFAQIISSVFFLIDDVRRLIQWAAAKTFFRNTEVATMSGDGISRSTFLSWIGLAAGTSLFGSLIYGFSNKYNYKVKHVKLSYDNLPEGFNGIKIVHFSDVHSGSFMNKKAVAHGVEKIMAENGDMVIFSGDLVNDRATEMKDYMDVFDKVKAPMGVYSTFLYEVICDVISQIGLDKIKKQLLLDLLYYLSLFRWL